MIFIHEGKEYNGTTAVEVLRKMQRDGRLRTEQCGSVRQFVSRSLENLADRIHLRELDTGAHLSDEALAFSYLCLLDEYAVGRLYVSASVADAVKRDKQ
jgi:hypothetical protein